MNNRNWKDAAELTSVVAIVASLIFVGLQLKQSHEIALAEIYQSRTMAVVEATNSMASNPYILSTYAKVNSGRADEISPEELLAAEWANWADLMLNENSYYQYRIGYLPEEHWQRVRRNLASAMRLQFDRELIDRSKNGMGEPFRRVIEQIEQELLSEPGA